MIAGFVSSANTSHVLTVEATIHPARYPAQIPRFFIEFLTTKGDLVLDPFGGSNTAGAVAEALGRKWMCFEIVEEYLRGTALRFDSLE